jgi:hypothetical protein
MANNVGPLTPTVQYVDPDTGKLTQAGHLYFSNLATQIGVVPGSPPASPSILPGTSFFDASNDTFYVYNGTAWKKVILT